MNGLVGSKNLKVVPIVKKELNMKQEIIKKEEETKITIAEKFIIQDAKSMEGAVELLSELNKANDRITKEKERLTKPLNEALRVERARWKPAETVLANAISIMRSKIGAYQSEQLAIQRAEEAKIASRVGEGKGKLKMETAIRKMGEVDTPEARVVTDSGKVSFRTVKKFRIINIDRIPRALMKPDEKAIDAQMKAGYDVEGVEYYEEQTVINKRN